jgi:hypothetical protein
MGAYDKKLPAQVFDRGGYVSSVKHPDFAGGAKGNNSTSDTQPFAAADAAATLAANPVVPEGVYRLNNLTLTKRFSFQRGGILKPNVGQVVSLPVPDAGPWQIFDTSLGGAGSILFTDAGIIHPEWFGHDVEGGADGNTAWVAMANAIVEDGCTIWLRPEYTYYVGNAVEMDPANTVAIVFDGIRVHVDGGGGLSRMPVTAPAAASIVLRILNADGITFRARLDGRKDEVPVLDVDTVVIKSCTNVHVPYYESIDSARHGLNLTDCTGVVFGDAVSYDSRKYGVSLETPRFVLGGKLIARGSEERWGHELTDGPQDVVAGTVLAYGCLGATQLGSHAAEGQSSRGIVYPTIYSYGVDKAVTLAVGTEPTLAQIVQTTGVSIQGDTESAPGVPLVTPNAHFDTTIGTLDVHYASEAGLSAQLTRRLSVGQMRLINPPGVAPSSRGAYIIDGTEVLLLGGYVRGWGRMLHCVGCEKVIIRNLVFDYNSGRALFEDCRWISLQGCTWLRNTPPDYLVHVQNSAGFAMDRVEVVDCTVVTGTDANTKTSLRIDCGSTGTLAELHVRGTRDMTLDIFRPSNYEPVTAYYTDDETHRTLIPANSSTPRVDRSRSWIVANTAATNLTGFTGGRDGMLREIFWNDTNTTAVHSATFNLIGGATRAPAANKYSLFMYRGTAWVELLYR